MIARESENLCHPLIHCWSNSATSINNFSACKVSLKAVCLLLTKTRRLTKKETSLTQKTTVEKVNKILNRENVAETTMKEVMKSL
jgi:hypothetical protein